MKIKLPYIVLIGAMIGMGACEDAFLDKVPKDQISNPNYWKTDNDFRTYSLALYNFYGFGVGNDYSIDNNSDETCKSNMSQDARIFDRRVIPNTGGGWDWEYVRSVNILIREARQSILEPEDKLHWEAVGRFFRAREYFHKVKSFGKVPWIGSELNVDSEELNAPQSPRAVVMDSVLADLNFATEHLREEDASNQIVKDVAHALKSRICLFEGTFRKYHTELGLTDADRWLRESVSAAEALMNSGKYQLSEDYRSIYSSVDLAGNPEIILYKQYEPGVMVNIRTRMIGLRTSATPIVAGTKDAIESYLCSDGLPYGVSPTHPKAMNGEPEFLDEEFANRDPRLGKTFVIPYQDDTPQQDPPLVETSANYVPPFMPSYQGEGYVPSATGYHPYKWWNPASPYDDVNGTLDAPLYTFNEVLLNYAEAKAELGECTNAELDQSINKLRARVNMPALTVEIAAGMNDPKHQKYAPEITPLLWEIRRERQVELMLDGTRLDDILRWKKVSYFSKPFVGAYINLEDRPALAYNEDGSPKADVVLGDREGNVLTGALQGYILPYRGENPPVYSDDDLKLYYNPLPTQELLLNPNLEQSPGW